jgi:predicted metallo-beta-lactamase superfamily hydrolase
MSGPPLSLLSPREVETSKRNIQEISTHCDELILDHHHVRDPHFKENLPEIWNMESVKTAAEYRGSPNRLLEAHRKELYSGETILY